jgi:hypothetical protein
MILFAYGAITRYGVIFQCLLLKIILPHRSPTTPMSTLIGLASSAFARHYLRNHYCFLFLRLLRCFSSAGLRLLLLIFNQEGCPIRTSADQTVVCTYPQLFAAYHVLRRLQEPRHPPYALNSLPTLGRITSTFFLQTYPQTLFLGSINLT